MYVPSSEPRLNPDCPLHCATSLRQTFLFKSAVNFCAVKVTGSLVQCGKAWERGKFYVDISHCTGNTI